MLQVNYFTIALQVKLKNYSRSQSVNCQFKRGKTPLGSLQYLKCRVLNPKVNLLPLPEKCMGKRISCHDCCQEVSRCHTTIKSEALKPRGDFHSRCQTGQSVNLQIDECLQLFKRVVIVHETFERVLQCQDESFPEMKLIFCHGMFPWAVILYWMISQVQADQKETLKSSNLTRF